MLITDYNPYKTLLAIKHHPLTRVDTDESTHQSHDPCVPKLAEKPLDAQIPNGGHVDPG